MSNKAFRVAELFLVHKKEATKIAEEFGQELQLTREDVYPLLRKARDLGFIRLVPPREIELERRISEEFKSVFQSTESKVTVVDVEQGKDSGEHVAAVAAQRTLDLIDKVNKNGRAPVRVGLGPGRATLSFSRHLGNLLCAKPLAPKLKLYAISSGCPAHSPEYAPTSFFNLFPRDALAGCIGLFAQTLVPAKDFEAVKKLPGASEAFAEKDEIDIVVTAMGSIEDEHDLLRRFLEQAGVNLDRLKSKKGCIGNVQYRPFSDDGPISEEKNELRAVTLFELDDLVSLTKSKGKHVVLMARRCGECGKTKAKAVRALLRNPMLWVWSELVMDVATAREILQPDQGTSGTS